MARKYGLPYQGSKNKLAERIVALLPPATHLYDVFAGGCAVTHAALLSGKFKEVHANDITDSVTLFEDALNGKYESESRWISREDFFRLKDSDPYVRIVWSFGNNQQAYLYSKKIEPYKKAVHEMLYAATPNERRLKFKAVIRELEKLGVISTPPPIYERQSGGGREAKDLLGQYERLQTTERAEQVKAIRNEINRLEHNERTAKIAALGSIQLSENRGGVIP
jgi:hypothetical protein|uniref:D12 class N6 adenine-specific DNA methyltransferase n=1 Tax=virus sp. ctoYX9 TaxID=2825822 RepID=A0A8S5RNM7_9VIRU|nr:MAG TPA: D12 class N6 adenine-specific DNA methyltransferase [virus sp. ctoYX9]